MYQHVTAHVIPGPPDFPGTRSGVNYFAPKTVSFFAVFEESIPRTPSKLIFLNALQSKGDDYSKRDVTKIRETG